MFATSEALNTPSTTHIKANTEELYRFQIEYKEYDTLIKFLLRNIPRILSDFVNNNEVCRSVQLLRYFGEDTKNCGKCDVCTSKKDGYKLKRISRNLNTNK